MVLKILKYLFILSFLIVNSQTNLELIHSDNFDVNYYYSENPSITNKLYIGCDAFRFLDANSMDTCVKYLQNYIKECGIGVDDNYELHNNNLIAFNINLNETTIAKLVPTWKQEFDKNWYKLVFSEIEPILNSNFSTFKNSTDGVFYSILQYEKRNILSEYNMIFKTNFAFVVNDKLPLVFFENRNVYTRNFRNTNTLEYTESIIVNNQNSAITYSFPFVNKKSKITDCLSLNIIKQAIKDDSQLFLEYGINQVVLTSIENDLKIKLELNKLITIKNFESLKSLALTSMKNSVNMNNLFFYSKYDLDVMEKQIDSFSFNNFSKFLNELETSKYIISLNNENVVKDSLKLLPYNIGIFNAPLLFKPNSSKLLNELDSTEIKKLALFMKLNQEVEININGTSSTNEINKIEKKKIKELININNLNKTEYSISRKTNLSLLRSVSIYNELISLGIDKKRIKCNGISGKNLTSSVIFQIDN